ncbi:MAG: transketolase [Patescibacteria group bacterium]|jgi:transketolase
MYDISMLEKLAKLIRYYILVSTTAAGSGHPTSSLSAVELMAGLYFGGILRYDIEHPENPANDRVIFSKGHAAPLFYSLYAAAGIVTEKELLTLRSFGSRLEGHPTLEFSYTEAVTGSLGQGLSIGVGYALAMRLNSEIASSITPRNDAVNPKIYVLLGDSEMAEGQNWEAMQVASYYKLGNLIAVVDVNRLGQRGETMIGWDTETYIERAEAFGWKTILIKDGHNFEQISQALYIARENQTKPMMIIAKTTKGKGVSFLEDKENWHGKPLNETQLREALKELGSIDKRVVGEITKPNSNMQSVVGSRQIALDDRDQIRQLLAKLIVNKEEQIKEAQKIDRDKPAATRSEYGSTLVELGKKFRDVVVLDAEMANSTMSEKFKAEFPERFLEMFIAEQNMASVAVGLSKNGYIPFVSTFAAFLTRAYDQIRMARYNNSNINFIGSHGGLAATQDGISQMGLEDFSMFQSIPDSLVFYPADETATLKLVYRMYEQQGIAYMRTTKIKTDDLYNATDEFFAGGSKVLRQNKEDVCAVFSAGVPLYEALKAYDVLKKANIHITVVDLYSIKPLDTATIRSLAQKTKHIVTVEDHYLNGGLGQSVNSIIRDLGAKVINLAVTKVPRSGSINELLHYCEIDAEAIQKSVKDLLK